MSASGSLALRRTAARRAQAGPRIGGLAARRRPGAILVAAPLLAAGAAVLAWDYALLPEGALRYALYWLGLGLALGGAWIGATRARPGPLRQALALAAFGAVTWLPYLLRSPDRLLFIDERYHLDVLERMAATGGTQLQPRLYALPGSFPGLEDVALLVMGWTGVPALAAARLVTLPVHAVIPVLALAMARGVGLPPRLAAVAALIYAANTSYLFFHSIFSYETLGIALYLAVWVVVVAWLRDPHPLSGRLLLAAVPLVAGITVTHHLSSYLLAIGLAIATGVLWRRGHPGARALAILTGIAIALAGAWFALNVAFLGPYLVGTMSERIRVILETLFADRSQPRALLANSPLPVPDRVVAILYPVLVLALGVTGLVAGFVLRRRGRLRSPAWVVLAIIGPLGWLATTPAVVTRGAELAYRSWPFLFLGVAPVAAVGVGALAAWLASRPVRGALVAARIAPPVLVGLLLAGGFTIGDNQAGRFPTKTPVTAAGPANATDDLVAAARWLRSTYGEDHVVVADSGSAVTFSTDGAQRMLRWNSWYPYLAPDPARILPFLEGARVEFLVVDLQVTELPPRYNGYFGPPAISPELDPGQPVPGRLMERLDGISGLTRIYDSGRVRIYAVTGATGALP